VFNVNLCTIVGASSKDGAVVLEPPELGVLLSEEPESSDCDSDGEFGDVLIVFESGDVEAVDPAMVVVEPATSSAATETLPFAVLIRTVSEVGCSFDFLPSPPQPAARTASNMPLTSNRRPVFLIDITSS
jgi:hypothetical protein